MSTTSCTHVHSPRELTHHLRRLADTKGGDALAYSWLSDHVPARTLARLIDGGAYLGNAFVHIEDVPTRTKAGVATMYVCGHCGAALCPYPALHNRPNFCPTCGSALSGYDDHRQEEDNDERA